MAAAFHLAGFDAWDVTMTDLLNGKISLDERFRGVVFVGGFSYGDVLDSAKGWAGVIRHNSSVTAQFEAFRRRSDTFSLGVCNGCQLMALLGWVPFPEASGSASPPARFIHNESGRYESRFVAVRVLPSPALMLKDMENSTLGVWVAHGEGKAHFPGGEEILAKVESANLAPLRYVDDSNKITTVYPFNPNGSPAGIAALCSPDGRHLVMMPHPERTVLKWQWAWQPHPKRDQDWEYATRSAAPWLQMFQNAYKWCVGDDAVSDDTPLSVTEAGYSRLSDDNDDEDDVQEAELKASKVIETASATSIIHAHLSHTLSSTHLPVFSSTQTKYVGKVRDTYCIDSETMVLITTDRLSAFDRSLCNVPFKGQVLNLVSQWWFNKTQHIIPNHLLSVPHPNVTIGKRCKLLPIEVVVRAYVTGSTGTSLWTHYSRGVREYCGHKLADGMVKNQRLPHPIVTPTTKSDEHDVPISGAEIVSGNHMNKEQWEYVEKKALEIFTFGQQVALEHGLLLVDTKYEFGVDTDGVIRLIDEIHTPDSSRYWLAPSYESRMSQGLEPENIDKEFLRLWYISVCDPYKDDTLPEAPAEKVVELAQRYILLYEKITGQGFPYPDKLSTNLSQDIEIAVTNWIHQNRPRKDAQ